MTSVPSRTPGHAPREIAEGQHPVPWIDILATATDIAIWIVWMPALAHAQGTLGSSHICYHLL